MNEPLRYRHSSIQKARSLRKEMTDAERKLWARLRRNQTGVYFRRQTPVGEYIVDFICWKSKLIVEVDGGHHYTDKGLRRDRRRDEFLNSQGFRVLRFSNIDVLRNPDGVIEKILEELGDSLRSH